MLKKLAPVISKAVTRRPSVATGAAFAATALVARRKMPTPSVVGFPPAPAGFTPRPGLKGKVQRFLPGGETGYIKKRRMNVTNPRALRRAIRRATGFAKLARRVLSFVDARAPKARAKFRSGRK